MDEKETEEELRKGICDVLKTNGVGHLIGEIFGRINAICDIKTGEGE